MRLPLQRRSRRGVLWSVIGVEVMVEIAVVEVEVVIVVEVGIVIAIAIAVAVEVGTGLEVVLEDASIVWRKIHRP